MNKREKYNNKMTISFNNSPKINKKIKEDSNGFNLINKTEINEEDKFDNNGENKSFLVKNKDADSSNIQNNNLIKSIDTINEDAIEKYSKK